MTVFVGPLRRGALTRDPTMLTAQAMADSSTEMAALAWSLGLDEYALSRSGKGPGQIRCELTLINQRKAIVRGALALTHEEVGLVENWWSEGLTGRHVLLALLEHRQRLLA